MTIQLDTAALAPDPDRIPVRQQSYGIDYSVINHGELRTVWEILVRSIAASTMAARTSDECHDICRECQHHMLHADFSQSRWLSCEARVEDYDDCTQLDWAAIESEAASIIMETLSIGEDELHGMWTRKSVREEVAA